MFLESFPSISFFFFILSFFSLLPSPTPKHTLGPAKKNKLSNLTAFSPGTLVELETLNGPYYSVLLAPYVRGTHLSGPLIQWDVDCPHFMPAGAKLSSSKGGLAAVDGGKIE